MRGGRRLCRDWRRGGVVFGASTGYGIAILTAAFSRAIWTPRAVRATFLATAERENVTLSQKVARNYFFRRLLRSLPSRCAPAVAIYGIANAIFAAVAFLGTLWAPGSRRAFCEIEIKNRDKEKRVLKEGIPCLLLSLFLYLFPFWFRFVRFTMSNR